MNQETKSITFTSYIVWGKEVFQDGRDRCIKCGGRNSWGGWVSSRRLESGYASKQQTRDLGPSGNHAMQDADGKVSCGKGQTAWGKHQARRRQRKPQRISRAGMVWPWSVSGSRRGFRCKPSLQKDRKPGKQAFPALSAKRRGKSKLSHLHYEESLFWSCARGKGLLEAVCWKHRLLQRVPSSPRRPHSAICLWGGAEH